MAERFDFETIYDDTFRTIIVSDQRDIQEEFFQKVIDFAKMTNFPNLDVSINDYVTGGILFNKETTKMVKIQAKSSQFKKFQIFFRVQVFGKVAIFSRLSCMEKGILDTLTGKNAGEMYYLVRKKAKNMAQYEEFITLENLSKIIFKEALSPFSIK